MAAPLPSEPYIYSSRHGPGRRGAGTGGRVRLRTLVYIRWAAIAGQFASLLIVHYGFHFPLPIVWALAAVAVSALLNIAVTVRQPLGAFIEDRSAALYLAYDIAQLSVLLYLAGGLQNPFSVLILAPVIVSASVLSRRSTIALGALSAVSITVLAQWHQPFPWRGAGFPLPELYVMAIWGALFLGIVFIAAYVGSVAQAARQMSNALAATQMALAREQRLSALGGLAAAAAHELGSPLATIAVAAREMSREVEKGTALAEDVDLLIEQCNRCRDILAELSRRPETYPGEPFARLPVSALVEASGEPYVGGPVALRFHRLPPGDGDALEPNVARSPEILHGLGTLIENAVQFARTRVDVGTAWDASSVTVTVVDDGPGFAGAVRDRLGEPYVSSRDGQGHMGLGVFIASTLLGHTGGELSFTNAGPGGASVAIRWNRSTIEAERDGTTT
ncbi:MAG: ActS/PrrB/RegB family redox-sensitive histidine kinase [Alphaproteobacteria bacterium]